VECCYARQTKFWVTDPDRTLWEVYTLDEDIDHRGAGQSLEQMLPDAGQGRPAAVWEHRLDEPVPAALPVAPGSADEVRLRGSLNVPLAPAEQRLLVALAAQALRPGGRLFVHVLVAERPLSAPPDLPGPAASVRHVPLEAGPVRLLEEAGLRGARMVKYDEAPCFVREGVGLRELQLEAWKASAAGGTVTVLYKGPFRQVSDDAGNTYPRGARVEVSAACAAELRRGETGEQFLFLA
jgi:hypothetical protein